MLKLDIHVGLNWTEIRFLAGSSFNLKLLYTKTNGTFSNQMVHSPGGGTGISTLGQDFNRLEYSALCLA